MEEGAVSPCSQPDPRAWEDAECLRFGFRGEGELRVPRC